jgi:hypothetical protein
MPRPTTLRLAQWTADLATQESRASWRARGTMIRASGMIARSADPGLARQSRLRRPLSAAA